MGGNDSALDVDAVARARALLTPPAQTERLWPALGAAAFLAMSSMAFAVAMVTAPPVVTQHTAKSAP